MTDYTKLRVLWTDNIAIYDEHDTKIAIVCDDSRHAELIVKAVNAHQPLIELAGFFKQSAMWTRRRNGDLVWSGIGDLQDPIELVSNVLNAIDKGDS